MLWVSDGSREEVPLNAGSIAALHRRLIAMLDAHGLPSSFNGTPNEIEGAVPFAEDNAPRDYDRDSARRVPGSAWRRCCRCSRAFRAGFSGKASPVHFWWGSFDLAVTRFSGRHGAAASRAACPACPTASPAKPIATKSPAPASGPAASAAAEPFFYSYIYPEPDGYRTATVAHGRFDETFGEFVCPMPTSARRPIRARMLGEFLQSTYDAGADLANWDRAALEREPVAP